MAMPPQQYPPQYGPNAQSGGPGPYQQQHPQQFAPYAAPHGVPHPGPYDAPGPYAAPGPHAAPAPYAAPGPYAAPQSGQMANCLVCGGFPAVNVTIRGHQGVLVLMRFIYKRGFFCRTCGTAVRRDMTGRTLWQGWWSPLSLVIFTPFTLVWNLFMRAKLNKLQPPAPGTHGRQFDPGPPLLRRAQALGLLVPVLWLVFIFIQYARAQ
jgi:hypothetical protein